MSKLLFRYLYYVFVENEFDTKYTVKSVKLYTLSITVLVFYQFTEWRKIDRKFLLYSND